MAKVADGIRYAERVVAGEIVAGEFVRLHARLLRQSLELISDAGEVKKK